MQIGSHFKREKKMYIELDGQPVGEKLRLKAKMVEGELVITEEDEGWSVIALRVVCGKLVLVRYPLGYPA